MKKTLLQQAREMPTAKRSVQPRHEPRQVESLVIAWLKDEVTNSQMCKVLSGNKTDSWNQMYRVAVALKSLYRKGKLKIK